MAREAVKLGDRVMVDLGLPITEYHRPPRMETAGRALILRDAHHSVMPFQFEFESFHQYIGDVIYFMYIPVPAGEMKVAWFKDVLEAQHNEELNATVVRPGQAGDMPLLPKQRRPISDNPQA